MKDLLFLSILPGFILWFWYYKTECVFNGIHSVWTGLKEDFLWSIPGGSKRKGEFIRKSMEGFADGAMCASSGSWTYKEIREKNLYEEVGNAMLPGWPHFLFTHICIPLLPSMFLLLPKLLF